MARLFSGAERRQTPENPEIVERSWTGPPRRGRPRSPRWGALLAVGAAGFGFWLGRRARRAERRDESLVATRLRAVMDALPVGVFIAAADGRMVKSNPAAGEIWDASAPPLLGALEEYGTYVAYRADTGQRVQSDQWGTARVLATGEATAPEELEIGTFSGRRKTILHSAAPIRDASGKVVEVVAVNIDLTERKRAEQARELEREELLVREQRARSEAERWAREEAALRDAVTALTETFTTEQVIDAIAARAMTAVDADIVMVTRIHPGEVEVVACTGNPTSSPLGRRKPYAGSLTERVIEARRPVMFEAGAASGAEVFGVCPPCSLTVVPLMDAGQAIGALFLFRAPERPELSGDEVERAYTFGDLAALAFRRVHMFEDAQRRNAELERVTESRARLVRGFSHDLRNPLGAADGSAALLQDPTFGELSDEQRRGLERIRRSIRRALELTDDLLELVRAEAGDIQLALVPTDLREAARELSEEHRARANGKELLLKLEVQDRLPLIVSDASRVRQILGNLVSNALKYTDRGSVTIRVGRAGPSDGGWITVDVSDTGPGIAESEQRAIFDEFARGGAQSKPGVGLGLAISRRIARALGGDITLESELGRGSTFTLRLPLDGPPR